jgi:hypothetical protein
VLFRKSKIWDPAEGSFAEPLTTTTMSASEIMALYKGDDSVSANSTDSVLMEGKDSFTLKWMRTSPPTERVFEAGESNKILVFWKYRFHTYCLEDWLCVFKWRQYAIRVL